MRTRKSWADRLAARKNWHRPPKVDGDESHKWGTCAVGEALDLRKMGHQGGNNRQNLTGRALQEMHPYLYELGGDFPHLIDGLHNESMQPAIQTLNEIKAYVEANGGPDEIRHEVIQCMRGIIALRRHTRRR